MKITLKERLLQYPIVRKIIALWSGSKGAILHGKPVLDRLRRWYRPTSKKVQIGFVCLLSLLVLSLCMLPNNTFQNRSSPPGPVTDEPGTEPQPLALVYRGPASCKGCSEALAALLQSSQWRFDVRYVGSQEALSVADGLKLPNVKVYAQPGGGDDVKQAFTLLQADTPAIRNFIRAGGRYLGVCMGAYLAGNPGFNLLSRYGHAGDTGEYVGKDAKTPADTVLRIKWQGNWHPIYFQNGPYFDVSPKRVTVLARYTTGQIAMMTAPYGQGKIGVSGPHPEATPSWYSNINHPFVDTAGIGHSLIDRLMQ
jgi:glutamine amidotransferase-like uncharacterized protein